MKNPTPKSDFQTVALLGLVLGFTKTRMVTGLGGMRCVLRVSALCLALVCGLEKDVLAAIKSPKGKSVMWATYGGASQNIFSHFKGRTYKTIVDNFGLPDKQERKKTNSEIDIIWCHYSGVHIVDLQRSKAQKVWFKIYRYKSGLTSVDEVKLDTSNMLWPRERLEKYVLGSSVRNIRLRGLLSTSKQRILKRRTISQGRIFEEYTHRTLYTYGPLTWVPNLKKHDFGVTITANEIGAVIDVAFR